MFFDGDIASDDEQAMFGQDLREVKVVVDPASAQLLVGATLDYKDGLDQSGLRNNESERKPYLRLRAELLLTSASLRRKP